MGNEKQVELTGIWFIGVNFSEILIKRKEILFELVGNLSYPSSSYWGSIVSADVFQIWSTVAGFEESARGFKLIRNEKIFWTDNDTFY